eukprot:COSAG02_NODE_6468_length_3553_cov_2.112044_3_plen_71_part_00
MRCAPVPGAGAVDAACTGAELSAGIATVGQRVGAYTGCRQFLGYLRKPRPLTTLLCACAVQSRSRLRRPV